MIRRIFISSVQWELAAERKAIVELVSANPQLARVFDTFAFEFHVPATDKRTDEVYLSELAVSDVYVGIIGNEYGGLTPDGIPLPKVNMTKPRALASHALFLSRDRRTRIGIPVNRHFCAKFRRG